MRPATRATRDSSPIDGTGAASSSTVGTNNSGDDRVKADSYDHRAECIEDFLCYASGLATKKRKARKRFARQVRDSQASAKWCIWQVPCRAEASSAGEMPMPMPMRL